MKTETKAAAPTELKIIPLQELYLNVMLVVADSLKLQTVQQVIGDGDQGRLWLVRHGTTVPHAQVAYKFETDSVTFGVVTRDERQLSRVVKYAEGLDGFAEELARFMQANQLGKPKRATPGAEVEALRREAAQA